MGSWVWLMMNAIAHYSLRMSGKGILCHGGRLWKQRLSWHGVEVALGKKILWERRLEKLGGGGSGGTVLRMAPQSLCILGKHSTTEPHSWLQKPGTFDRIMLHRAQEEPSHSLRTVECQPQKTQEFLDQSTWSTGLGGTCRRKAHFKVGIWLQGYFS